MNERVAHTGRFRWTSASATHVGTVRDLNEDSCLELPESSLWAVADGMGGHEAGDVASRTVLDCLRNVARAGSLEDDVKRVVESLGAANSDLRRYASENTKSGIVGTTIAVVLGSDDGIACLWAGDSRIYLLRDGKLKQLTEDHSRVQELISLGRLDAADAKSHPYANVVTRAVGATENLDIDVASEAVHHGDTFLICSDGLTNAVSDDELRALMGENGSGTAVEGLLGAALNNGATDNVTIVVVHVEDAIEGTAD